MFATGPPDCTCGSAVKTVEVRVVQRCGRGHFVAVGAAPTVLEATARPEPPSPGQLRGIHAKANALDLFLGREAGVSKRQALAEIGLASTTEIASAGAASVVLDWLESHLDDVDPSGERRAALRGRRRA